MTQILTPKEAIDFFSQSHLSNTKLVLVGGCFDILHPGHISFLTAAKAKGDKLVILLEADESVRLTKGSKRPINSQILRAQTLANHFPNDSIVLLTHPFTNNDYDNFVTSLKPAIIATTKGDPYIHHKLRQAKLIGAKVEEVIDRIPDHSTTALINTTL